MRKIRIGIIGFGRLGSTHAKNIAESKYAELYSVCDNDKRALECAVADHKVKAHLNLAEFLAEPLDAVVVASSTPLHLDHIRACAKAGKHIFTEKPIGLTLEETDEALREVVDAGVLFQIGFQRRWDRRFLKAKKLITDGVIGEPVLFKAYGRDPNASNPANWGLDKNGGLFLNAAIHDYDAARFILDTEVTKISATGAALVYPGLAKVDDIDTCSTSLFLGDHKMAMTEWSRYAVYGYDIGAEIIGTKGSIRIGGDQKTPVTLHLADKNTRTVFEEFADAYKAEIEAFIRSIVSGTPASPGVEDARIALNLALFARTSYQKNGEAVSTPLMKPLVRDL
ncbi:MAG TPA: Gfo/Idh/MocA family oxidoreductase [Patescibacteria group bacterium]|nr:Gfo/Idh/MocA family oxidoreductase [Patescibacteria group bacterium]